ncbi:MAG TPA: IclR family transcriptional regulator C-terminal domain-containing protein [Pseudolysinimonas sp.]|nr:IclR family transcriptional regulator C-terminal domain-containing protein [Pseudolysinimonas sp.]
MAGEEYVQSLARGLEVLRAFDATRPRQTLSEVAAATGLSRAAARRFLLTLAELGYLRTDGKTYALTPRVLDLGYGYLSTLTLPELAMPHLERLSAEVGESSSASILDGGDVVYVARVPVQRIMAVSIAIGTRFPAWATSMGRVLLAGTPGLELPDELPALTDRSLRTRAELEAELARIEAQGYALVDGELEAGLRSMAVRVNGADTLAAINVAGRSDDDPEAFVARVLPPLREAAAAIEADLAAGR